MNPNKSQIFPSKFICELCPYKTCNKKDYNKHLITSKHINRINLNILEQEQEKGQKYNFICNNCNKTYKARNSLWYHERKCKPSEDHIEKIVQSGASISGASISGASISGANIIDSSNNIIIGNIIRNNTTIKPK
jgi:NDP-sugar pyrophosphorylase family protein